ncbi:PAS domain-containing sensor histidine kinase [Metabacillus litoralis]|uniref:PAS domain-containing sensor histidine kinase n=1 Tax=Metabacillus litoralis TaxID=152268 RepID=UPI003342AD74
MLEDKNEMIALLTGVESSKKSYYTELKKTVDMLQKKNMQLEIMNEVMKSIKIDMTLEEILNNMVDKLKNIIQFDRLSFFLLQNVSLTLINVFPENTFTIERGIDLPRDRSLYWMALTKRQVMFQQVENPTWNFHELEFLRNLKLNSILVVPIYSKNKEIGVICIGRCFREHWHSDDIAFLEQLADHLAVSIENTQLYNEVLRSKQEWENTFKAVDDMIIIFDKHVNVIQMNDSVRHFLKTHHHKDNLLLEQHYKRLANKTFQTEKARYKEIHFEDQSTFELYTYPVYNNKNIVNGVIAYVKDVTEKRKMEVQLLHSGKLAAIGEMAAGVAHELNSPLTAILGNSQLLLRNVKDDDDSFTLLRDIKTCGIRCKDIIKSLLAFSRQEEYTFQSFHINDAVKQVLNLLEYQLEKNQITVITNLHKDLPMIEGSQQQIEQIIINLLLNAKDAVEAIVKDDKEIEIMTSLENQAVKVSVLDNGIGIEQERLSKIFHPFHTTKEAEKGTGLGLSVSIGIAKTHGGSIDVISEVNKGSTFQLVLPLQPTNKTEASV